MCTNVQMCIGRNGLFKEIFGNDLQNILEIVFGACALQTKGPTKDHSFCEKLIKNCYHLRLRRTLLGQRRLFLYITGNKKRIN